MQDASDRPEGYRSHFLLERRRNLLAQNALANFSNAWRFVIFRYALFFKKSCFNKTAWQGAKIQLKP